MKLFAEKMLSLQATLEEIKEVNENFKKQKTGLEKDFKEFTEKVEQEIKDLKVKSYIFKFC